MYLSAAALNVLEHVQREGFISLCDIQQCDGTPKREYAESLFKLGLVEKRKIGHSTTVYKLPTAKIEAIHKQREEQGL